MIMTVVIPDKRGLLRKEKTFLKKGVAFNWTAVVR
jgi:hypothetical protein